MARASQLPCVKAGKLWRFSVSQSNAWVASDTTLGRKSLSRTSGVRSSPLGLRAFLSHDHWVSTHDPTPFLLMWDSEMRSRLGVNCSNSAFEIGRDTGSRKVHKRSQMSGALCFHSRFKQRYDRSEVTIEKIVAFLGPYLSLPPEYISLRCSSNHCAVRLITSR